MIADATYNLIVIGLAEVGHQDSDAQGTAIAKSAREQARLIIEFFCRRFDAVAR